MKETPMMEQFRKIKEQYPDALLLFRCGDFYETYSEDAIKASKVLNITLTRRNNGASTPSTEMAGFPFHALDTYLPKLVRSGMRVAICDQLEDPKLAKKLVKRGVTELVTPGLNYSDAAMPAKENNFVSCVHFAPTVKGHGQHFGIAFLDISTGEFMAAEGNGDYINNLLSSFAPKEVLFIRDKKQQFEEVFGNRYFTYCLDDWMLTLDSATDRLTRQFGVQNLKGFGFETLPQAVTAAGGILHYLDMTQHLQTGHIQHLSRIEADKYVWLDTFTIRNLEMFGASPTDPHTLLGVINRTLTPMGSRLLKRWVGMPLKEVRPIRNRQQVVEYFFRHPDVREELERLLTGMNDVERLVSRLSTGRISPRELAGLGVVLQSIVPVKTMLEEATESSYLQTLNGQLSLCEELALKIKKSLAVNPPAIRGKGDMIGAGVDEELDRLRDIRSNSKDYLVRLQQREIERTGIQSLKISYNNVFGYYLEVRNTYKDMVPQDWIRKQTLVNAERYITPELKTYEEEINTAEEKIQIIEGRIFDELVMYGTQFAGAIQTDANVLAQLDCLLSFALVAADYHYVCPEVNDGLVIDIRQGRHPVIERHLPAGESYIANDVRLDNESQQIIVLTGPNMAGKSALLRQTALITLMAQIGSFVPAESASVGLVDKVFTRVGASDNISSGESTFMVEMNEAAGILNNLSERSLVLFDELGRGTSTYDGISIAWAIVEYLHESRYRAKTLFATHYHELNEMEKTFERIRNYNVSVKELDGKVIFLRRLAVGGSEHSFGIHVAQLAGMPKSIVERAKVILADLEGKQTNKAGALKQAGQREGLQLSIFQLDDPVLEQIRDEVKAMDINKLTPIDALNKLSEIKKLVGG